MNDTSNEDLLPRVGTGDAQAVEQCLDRYSGLVWSLARRHAPSGEAEDAVQDIFVSLWQNADRFDPAIASEGAFVTMIARRRLVDKQRRASRRPATTEIPEFFDLPDEAPGVEVTAEARLARRALAKLGVDERRAVMLSAYHGLSHGQIAEHTGMPLGTVKTYVRRGLRRVRDALLGPAGTGRLEEVEA